MTRLDNSSPNFIIKLSIHSICVFMIAIYMMLLPFEYIFASESGTVNKYIGVAVIALCFLGGEFRLRFRSSMILIICFLAYGFCSGLWAISLSHWSDNFFIYLRNAALFIAVAQCRYTKKQSDMIMVAYVAGSVALALYLITSSNAVVDPYSGRTIILINGGMFDPNYMAADIIVPMGYMCGLFYNNLAKKEYKKAFLAIAVILLLLYIEILSGSRGGLLAIVAMVLAITLLNMKNRDVRRKILLIALVMIIVFMVIKQMLPEQIQERFSFESLTGETDSGSGRLDLWDAAWNGIRENFFFGYGAGCANPIVGTYHGIDRAVHSLYLLSWLEFGVFALLLYVGILSEMKKAYKASRYTEVGISIGILTASIFLDALSTKFFWAFLIVLFTRNAMKVEPAEDTDLLTTS